MQSSSGLNVAARLEMLVGLLFDKVAVVNQLIGTLKHKEHAVVTRQDTETMRMYVEGIWNDLLGIALDTQDILALLEGSEPPVLPEEWMEATRDRLRRRVAAAPRD